MIKADTNSSESWIAHDKQSEYQSEQIALIKFRDDVLVLSNKRKDALLSGNLMLAHELGNQLDTLGNELQPLITSSKKRLETYTHMYLMFSTMDPFQMSASGQMAALEKDRIATYKEVSAVIGQLSKLLNEKSNK